MARKAATKRQRRYMADLARRAGVEVPEVLWADDARQAIGRLELVEERNADARMVLKKGRRLRGRDAECQAWLSHFLRCASCGSWRWTSARRPRSRCGRRGCVGSMRRRGVMRGMT